MTTIQQTVAAALGVAATRYADNAKDDALPEKVRKRFEEQADEAARLAALLGGERLLIVEEPSSAATLLAAAEFTQRAMLPLRQSINRVSGLPGDVAEVMRLIDTVYQRQSEALIRYMEGPAWIDLANRLLDYGREQYDAKPDEDGTLPATNISGADFLAWFDSEYRPLVVEAVAAHARIMRELGATSDDKRD